MNAITRQQVSIVSSIAGTTTDPVEKPMELLPLGPVLFIDTAGIDDEGALGRLRVEKARQILERTDLAVLVAEAGTWGAFEDRMLAELREREIPVVVAFNKCDAVSPDAVLPQEFSARDVPAVSVSALSGQGILDFRQALLDNAPAELIDNPTIAGDLVAPGETAVLVIPLDKEAPRAGSSLPRCRPSATCWTATPYVLWSRSASCEGPSIG